MWGRRLRLHHLPHAEHRGGALPDHRHGHSIQHRPAQHTERRAYAILTGDNTQLVEMTNASATTMTIPVANSAGFLSGWGTNVLPTLAATVLTPASGTACGLTSVSLDPGQFLGLAAGASTNYDCALGIPTSGTQNKVLATPNGSTGQPKLRALVAADLPLTAVTPGSYTSYQPNR